MKILIVLTSHDQLGDTGEKAALTQWCKEIAPSGKLRRWYGHDDGPGDRRRRTDPGAGRPGVGAPVTGPGGAPTIDGHLCGVVARATAARGRLRRVGWPIIQTAVAAGLAWYVARTLLGHPQPFFAPVAAAVCLSASTVLRGQRAVQMIAGVALGIGAGVGAHAVADGSAIAVGLAVLVALVVAVVLAQGFIAQGLMFYNQTAASAILIIATEQTATGAVDAAASAQRADHLAVTAVTTTCAAGPASTPVIASLAHACAQDLTHIADPGGARDGSASSPSRE